MIALLLAAACRSEPTEPVTRDQFVDVMAALRTLSVESATPAEFNAGRDSILRAAGVTDSALVAFARRHGGDVDFMAAIWDSIAIKLLDDDTIMR